MNTVLIYLAAIAIAELAGVFISPLASLLIHAGLIGVLLGHYLIQDKAPYRRVLPILLLAPLLRLLSLALPAPFRLTPQIYWYALVGAPLLLAAILVIRLLGLTRTSLGLQDWPPRALPQGLIALSGLPLGIAAFSILWPKPVINGADLGMVAIGSIVVAIFAGFTEEFIFRGLLQRVVGETFNGRVAVIGSSLLFAVMYVGSLSVVYVAFISLVGLYFGYCVYKTGSLWGVIVAHSFMAVGAIVIWPVVANRLW